MRTIPARKDGRPEGEGRGGERLMGRGKDDRKLFVAAAWRGFGLSCTAGRARTIRRSPAMPHAASVNAEDDCEPQWPAAANLQVV